eukprot:scaffold23568_cov75-Phaeocystis_antarctica.AAC.1
MVGGTANHRANTPAIRLTTILHRVAMVLARRRRRRRRTTVAGRPVHSVSLAPPAAPAWVDAVSKTLSCTATRSTQPRK